MSQIIGMKRGFYEIKYNTIHSQSKTLASEMSLTAAASTIFLITNFLMALSLGTQRAQLVQRMGCTCPRPFLARPLFLLFLVCQNTIRVTNDKVNLSKMLKQNYIRQSQKFSCVKVETINNHKNISAFPLKSHINTGFKTPVINTGHKAVASNWRSSLL